MKVTLTQTQWSALESAVDALTQDARHAENCGELDVARDIDEQVSVLQDILDEAEIVERVA